jgi:hypothetical protein
MQCIVSIFRRITTRRVVPTTVSTNKTSLVRLIRHDQSYSIVGALASHADDSKIRSESAVASKWPLSNRHVVVRWRAVRKATRRAKYAWLLWRQRQ